MHTSNQPQISADLNAVQTRLGFIFDAASTDRPNGPDGPSEALVTHLGTLSAYPLADVLEIARMGWHDQPMVWWRAAMWTLYIRMGAARMEDYANRHGGHVAEIARTHAVVALARQTEREAA